MRRQVGLKNKSVKFVAWLMLAVFLLGVAPKEYVHEVLFHHTDTVHPDYKKGEIVIGKKHIHCAFLNFVFAPFVATGKQYFVFKEPFAHKEKYLLSAYHFSYHSRHSATRLRGPPTIG